MTVRLEVDGGQQQQTVTAEKTLLTTVKLEEGDVQRRSNASPTKTRAGRAGLASRLWLRDLDIETADRPNAYDRTAAGAI